uniref:Transposon protein, putative, CACTA, En/Spm sub-class n=1 Tax=Oryza sativa subsp. japonica TaxID=39947 RepID=Q2R085_ORYSJ|nr:transposon protein, putative, CACTA, En/Spm sub-class [Oryza sativa Japonica Group]
MPPPPRHAAAATAPQRHAAAAVATPPPPPPRRRANRRPDAARPPLTNENENDRMNESENEHVNVRCRENVNENENDRTNESENEHVNVRCRENVNENENDRTNESENENDRTKTSENEGTNVNENKRTNVNENERTNVNELGNMADHNEEQILYDTIAEGSSQYWNEEEGNEDPNQYLNEEGNVERDAEGNQQGHVERDVEGNQEEEASGSQPSVRQKRARGQRGAAKKLEGRHIITEVEEDGRPSAPAEAAKNYVRHSGWVVRDNVPVSTVYWRRTRARGDHESFVPDSEKEMLWTTMLETFTLPAGTEDKVKRWTLKKMAEQFQSFKGDLYQKYILKGQTPNFDTFPKLRDHWDEFVAYKTGEQGQAMMERNKENAAKKKYHHHLGSGGYSVAMPKWEEMEASLIERGIEPATVNWPERSKFWYYAHGGTLNPADGSLVFGYQIQEAARRLTDAVEASSQGTFRPDRDRDELTLALQTPEHPGRTRGKGVIPWKIGFKEDIHTYRSRMRSKRDTEAKIADLEFRVSSYELNMQEEVARKVDERMAAHRSHDPQPTIPPAMMSPSGNRSSCASTGQVGSQSMNAMQTQDESTCPVDDITQRTPCELHIPFKNLSIKVASGMAIPTDPSGTYHCRPIPAGYSKVEVELVEGAYEDLELDYPGGDGSYTVSSSCSASTVSTSGSSIDSSSGSCTDSSSCSYTYSSASSSSGTFKVKGPPAPPPAHTRATKKAKVDTAKNKDPGYDCTQEELDAYVASEVKRQFKPRRPEKKIPIDPSVRNFFRGMSAPVKEAIKLSDYERTLKKASFGKSKPVPQLGEQPNQEIEPLVTGEDMTIEEFIIDTGLTTDQLLGVEPIEKAELKYMYELGKPLVKPELVQSLPTQMYKFHQLYVEMSATGREMIGARIRDPDFLQGDDILWINFKGIYEVYQLDALDVSIMSCWTLMEIQRARWRRVFDTGFIDPRRVNVAMLDQYPQETEDNLVHLLKAQHYKTFILLPYNTEFHWVLLLFDLSACTVNVYDSMDKKESTFDKVFELIDRAWFRFRHLVRGNWRERLRRRFKFPCAKQKQGTNLCGYYVCEYCHCLADQIITTRELDFIRMRDNLTTHKEFIAAVQEQLMGFINEEILDPKGEFYYDGNTIHRSLASELAATTTTSKS